MKKKKYLILSALLCAVVAAGAVVPTLAWLSSRSQEVTNVFVGQGITVSLDEAKVENNEIAPGNERVFANSYTYVAGSVLPKDPTPTVKANSADAYVFVVVENANSDVFGVDIQPGWTKIAESTDNSKTVYVYKEVVEQDKTADTKLDSVFTKVTVSSELTSEKLASLDAEEFIKATAYAIQAQAISKNTAFDEAVKALLGETVTIDYSVVVEGAPAA